LASARTLSLLQSSVEDFGVQEPSLGLVPKDVRQGCRCSVMHNAVSFSVWCLAFGAEHQTERERRFWHKSSRLCTQSRFTRCLTSRMEGPYILES